jgi:hypothetical protein
MFPSKLELQRAVAFGGADLRGDGVPSGARLKFEEWREKEVGFLLPKVWISVFGLRRELCEFLDLWAVGSMLGSTQIVDMETTRKSDFGRVLVAVLNPGLIPTQLDVVIGNHYVELEFEVEKRGFDENGKEVDVEWPVKMEECEGTGVAGGGRHTEVERSERMAKKQKRDEGSSGGDKEGGDVFVSWKEQVQNMSGEEFEDFLKAKADEILDKAAKMVIEDLADKLMGEADEAVQEVVRSAEGEMDGVGTEAEREERLLVAAGVPEATKAQIRASPRLQRSKDEHTLAKAEGRVARRNLELSEGISSSAPLFSVNRDLAMTCLQ